MGQLMELMVNDIDAKHAKNVGGNGRPIGLTTHLRSRLRVNVRDGEMIHGRQYIYLYLRQESRSRALDVLGRASDTLPIWAVLYSGGFWHETRGFGLASCQTLFNYLRAALHNQTKYLPLSTPLDLPRIARNPKKDFCM